MQLRITLCKFIVMTFISASATLFNRAHGLKSFGMPVINRDSHFITNYINLGFSVTVFCDAVSCLLLFYFLVRNDYVSLVCLRI